MNGWNRETPWRQGHALRNEDAKKLGLIAHDDDFSIFVVVSHDCDLAHEPAVEPYAEIIIGRHLEKHEGNHTNSKNPRKLHLPLICNGESKFCELIAINKQTLPKEELGKFLPSPDIALAPEALRILQRWLALRYSRVALPDSFNAVMDVNKMNDKISNVLKSLGAYIIAVFMDLDDNAEPHDDAPWPLSIFLMYDADFDPDKAELKAQKAAQQISSAFEKSFQDSKTKLWQGIELIECLPISNHVMTCHQSMKLKQWYGEHLSLRATPQHPIHDI